MWFTPLLGGGQQQLPEVPGILRIPNTLTSQPQTAPQIDWGNPITNKLLAWHVGPHVKEFTLVNNPTVVPTIKGLANNFQKASSQYIYKPIKRIGKPITLVVLCKFTTDNDSSIFSLGDSTANYGMNIIKYSTFALMQRPNPTGGQELYIYNLDTNWHVFTFAWDENSNLIGYVDGISVGIINDPAYSTATYDTFVVGADYRNNTASNFSGGQVALALTYTRVLSGAEVRSISKNPWQVFQAPQKKIFTFPARQTITRPVADVPWPSLNILAHKTKNQQQPQSTPQIDRSNPITKDLLDWQTADFLNGFTPVNSPATSYSHRGKAKNLVGASTQYLTKDLPASISNLNTTIVCVARGSGTGQLAGWGNSSVQFSVGIEYYLSALIWMRSYNAASSNNSLSGPYDTNWHVHIGIINQSGIMEYYRDGIAGTNNGPAQGGNGNVDRLYIGARSWGGTYSQPFTGDVALTAFFRRTLTRAEIKSISENPWQIFKGNTKYIPLYSPPWTGVPNSTNLYDDIDDSRDEDYIVSPDITYDRITSPTIFTLDKFLAPGEYSIKVRARKTATYGQVRSVLLDSYDRVVGTSNWQGLTNSFNTYSLPVTTSETAYRIKVEAQREGIILDGLVLHLDAGNSQSYPGSGTTWFDMSGQGNNGTLTNGPTFDANNAGSIVFDGVNDNVTTSSYDYGDAFTISGFLYPLYKYNISTFCSNSTGGGERDGFRILLNEFGTDNQDLRFQYGTGDNSGNIADSGRIVWGAWQHIACVVDKNAATLQLYYNGLMTVSSSLAFTNFNTNAQVRLGNHFTQNYPYLGRISCFSMYNRALSAAEIAQNFNALRGRFGI